MRSDQGSNFVGATGQVEELNLTAAAHELREVGAQWIMNPPHASNFGGVWERKIGQIRKALDFSLRHVKNHPLTFDELATLMAEAVAIVNATPLWPQSTNPNEPPSLSPNTLLTQKTHPVPPILASDTQDLMTYGKKRWKKVQALADLFWEEWKSHYLARITKREKWTRQQRGLQVGDIVVVKQASRRNEWPLAVIEEMPVSHDGKGRRAKVRLAQAGASEKSKQLTRPTSELALVWSVSSNSENQMDTDDH